jgi:hypothetical protein
MMGRMYACTWLSGTVNDVVELFELTVPSTMVVCIHEIHLSQINSEVSEQLPVYLYRVLPTITPGSGGTTQPSGKLGGVLDSAAGAVIKTLNTTPAASSASFQYLRRSSDNILNGWHWVFTPETRIIIPPSGVLVAKLDGSPSIDLQFTGEIIFEEIG